MSNLYLYIDLLTLAGPLALSFDKKVAFFKHWKALLLGILVMMLLFIPWDIVFTLNSIWGFNPDYLSGIELFNLPIEEWLFFIVVPYACLFIYACVKAYFPQLKTSKPPAYVYSVFATGLIVLGLSHLSNYYTAITFIGLGVYLTLHVYIFKSHYLNAFFIAYFISLIPFLIVNGVLTGSGIAQEVVWYSSDHILGYRLFTIPIEDTMYSMLMLLIVTQVYELTLQKGQDKNTEA